jgi:hypothetical protein
MRLDHVLRNIDNILGSIVINTTGMAYVIISREMRIFHFDLDLYLLHLNWTNNSGTWKLKW